MMIQTKALTMRVGMLKMGGFLHAGYESVLAADLTSSDNGSVFK